LWFVTGGIKRGDIIEYSSISATISGVKIALQVQFLPPFPVYIPKSWQKMNLYSAKNELDDKL